MDVEAVSGTEAVWIDVVVTKGKPSPTRRLQADKATPTTHDTVQREPSKRNGNRYSDHHQLYPFGMETDGRLGETPSKWRDESHQRNNRRGQTHSQNSTAK